MSRGLFLAVVEGPNAALWRDTELAALTRRDGVRAVARYGVFNHPRAVLYADLDDIGALGTVPRPPAGLALTVYRARQVGELRQPHGSDDPMACPILYTVRFKVPAALHENFDAWYETEHIPMAMGSPAWTMTRRYRFEADEPNWTHLAVHHLMDVRALQAPQMKAARLTPWRNSFAKEAWFAGSDRIIALQD